MVIWSGRGLLVFIFFIIGAAIGGVIDAFISPNMGISSWVIPLALFLAALFSWLFDKYRGHKGRVMYVNKGKANESSYKIKDSFMFIRMKYWTYIYIVLGIVAIVKVYVLGQPI